MGGFSFFGGGEIVMALAGGQLGQVLEDRRAGLAPVRAGLAGLANVFNRLDCIAINHASYTTLMCP